MTVLDILMMASLICIWLLLLLNITLTVAGYFYYFECEKKKFVEPKRYPMVSILVPAHNEALVIGRTVESLLRFDYPADKYEIIIVNDNSSDNSAEILAGKQKKYPSRKLKVINTDAVTGGKGKSRALNIAYKQCEGEFIVIYDADNTPESTALKYLVAEILSDDRYGAVIGKFRTRNRNASLLTRFINIETLSFQWMAQAGRWKLFKLVTIPGTNYIIRRSIIDDMGGWDEKALSEDTEVSYRLYLKGYIIKFLPTAVTWEQEPQTLKVWFFQRARWAQGNIYVVVKFIPMLFKRGVGRVRFDILYFLSVYFLLLTALVVSDLAFIGNAIGSVHTTLAQFSTLLWVMAIVLFVVNTFVAVTTEKGELGISNLFVVLLMYFTYSKLWMIVTIYGMWKYISNIVLKREAKWAKTVRYVEGKNK